MDAEMGIELDVQASRDGDAMVFHDEDLGRLTAQTGLFRDRDAGELADIPLRGSTDHIPSLKEVLDLVGGQVPLLIEIKTRTGQVARISEKVNRTLLGYAGPVGIMSFHPDVGRWFASRAPDRLRGLVVTEQGRRWSGPLARALAVRRARPHFLAYDIRDLPSRFAERQRRRGLKLLTWTCRSRAELERAAAYSDQIIREEMP